MKKPRGFSLVELLGVITILLLLLALLLPLFGFLRYKARTVECMNAKRQYMQCMALHASENGGRYPNDRAGWMIMNPHDIEWTMLEKLEDYGCKIEWVMCTFIPPATVASVKAGYAQRVASRPSNPKWILPGSSYWVMRGKAAAPAAAENLSANMNILSDRVSKHSERLVVFSDSVIWHPSSKTYESAHNFRGVVREFTAVYGDGHATVTAIDDARQRYVNGWDPWCW